MRLSIIVPLYNKEKFIERCLKSLLDQDIPYNEYEIIVVDDGSTDSGNSIVQTYCENHENIHLFSQQNQGVSAARNKGIEMAKGKYLHFLDSDDYVAPNVLNGLLQLCNINKLEILVFQSKFVKGTEVPNFSTSRPQGLSSDILDGLTYISKHGIRNSACLYLIERSFLLSTEITFMEGRFMEDSIFTTSLVLRANRISKVDTDVHRYAIVENSITTTKESAHALKFIDDLVFAIQEIDHMSKSLDGSHVEYNNILKNLKRKQQSYVFTLFIKTFRSPSLNFKVLKKILKQLNELEVYPIDRKIGGIGNKKTGPIYNMVIVPILNNKTLLFLSLRLKRLFSPN